MELIMTWMTNLSIEASSIFVQNRAFTPHHVPHLGLAFNGHLALVTHSFGFCSVTTKQRQLCGSQIKRERRREGGSQRWSS